MNHSVDPAESMAEKVGEEARRRDRWVKIGLLAFSAATLALLVTAALRENVFTEWKAHQRRYAAILREKAADRDGELLAERFRVEMRQVVLPELGTVDRCVSCHTGMDDPRMTGVPAPYAAHPGDYLREHEIERFGCTICHRGQGRAMDFEQAKSEKHHWDYPLLPTVYAQSSCGVCHSPEEVAVRGGDWYAAGAAQFEEKGCRSCHKLGGRGGNLGPELDNEGLKVRGQLPMARVEGPKTLPEWLAEHFRDPGGIVAGSRMPSPGLSPDENRALTTFMLSLQDRDLPSSYLTPERHLEVYRNARPPERTGEDLYRTFCSHCHDTGRSGRFDKFFGIFIPAIRGESYRSTVSPAYLAANIREGRPGKIMPGWSPASGGLSEEEIRRVAVYLLGREVSPDEWNDPKPSPAPKGDAERGRRLFAKNCSGCHGADGAGRVGPSLDTAVFRRYAGDPFLFRTIAEGRRNTAMPAFLGPVAGGLGEGDVNDLIAFLRTLGRGAVALAAPAAGAPVSDP
ncbi:MAG: c-type cytochrome [Candidatus Eisenbacteria bacterium]